jgi:hypothetical protein
MENALAIPTTAHVLCISGLFHVSRDKCAMGGLIECWIEFRDPVWRGM